MVVGGVGGARDREVTGGEGAGVRVKYLVSGVSLTQPLHQGKQLEG